MHCGCNMLSIKVMLPVRGVVDSGINWDMMYMRRACIFGIKLI